MAGENKDTDMLVDEQNKGNVNKGQDGMLTPEQIIAAEAAGKVVVPPLAPVGTRPNDGITIVDGPAPPGSPAAAVPAAPGAAPALSAEDKAKVVQIETIEQKILAGTELSDDEKAIVAGITAQLDLAPDAPKTIKIGGQEITEGQAWERVKKDWKIDPNLKVTVATQQSMVLDWAKAQNRNVQQVVTQQRSEEQAKVARELETRRHDIEIQNATVQAEKKALQTRKASLEKRANDPITENDLRNEDNTINLANQMKYMRKLDAQEELADLNTELQEVEKSSNEVNLQLIAAEVRTFVAEHPQLATAEDTWTVMTKLLRGESVSDEDRDKALEVDDIFKAAGDKKILPKHEFSRRSRQGGYAFVDTAQAGPGANLPSLPGLPSPAKSSAEAIRRFKERLHLVPSGTPAGGGAAPASEPGESAASQIIKHDSKVLGNEEDPMLKELGYQK